MLWVGLMMVSFEAPEEVRRALLSANGNGLDLLIVGCGHGTEWTPERVRALRPQVLSGTTVTMVELPNDSLMGNRWFLVEYAPEDALCCFLDGDDEWTPLVAALFSQAEVIAQASDEFGSLWGDTVEVERGTHIPVYPDTPVMSVRSPDWPGWPPWYAASPSIVMPADVVSQPITQIGAQVFLREKWLAMGWPGHLWGGEDWLINVGLAAASMAYIQPWPALLHHRPTPGNMSFDVAGGKAMNSDPVPMVFEMARKHDVFPTEFYDEDWQPISLEAWQQMELERQERWRGEHGAAGQ